MSRFSSIAYRSTFTAACVLFMGAQGVAQADDAPPSVPQENFLSSLKQAFKQDFDNAVVRGHFDVGTPPDTHRYYCLVDAKTGRRQANGVSGEPSVRRDGMTGIKVGATTLYDCASAEQQGMLVTSGYVLNANIRDVGPPTVRSTTPPAATPPGAAPPIAMPGSAAAIAPVAALAPATAATIPAPGQMEVAGVRLGMSPDEVRSVLRSKKPLEYFEAADSLRHSTAGNGVADSGSAGRFVNVIKTWTPTGDAESFEIMFTPVPGQERVMAIVHSTEYPASDAPSASALASALIKKYGGSVTAKNLPTAPTWRIQRGGDVNIDDACERRGIFGGIGNREWLPSSKVNVALKTTPDEFRYQIERCGVAIVTEDQVTEAVGGTREPRVIRFTVTAYSPKIAFEGSTLASQWMQAGASTAGDKVAAKGDAEVPAL